MYCPNCGESLNENAKFCPKCGTQVIISDPSQHTTSRQLSLHGKTDMDSPQRPPYEQPQQNVSVPDSNLENPSNNSAENSISEPSPNDTTNGTQTNMSRVKGCLFLLAIGIIFIYIFQETITIRSSESYGWFDGIKHGLGIIYNWPLSLFTDRLYHAINYTPAYNIFFWITAICVIGIVGFYAICIIIGLFIPDSEDDKN